MTFENKNNLPERLLQPYNPSATESVIYKIWEESGFFNPDICIEKGVTSADAESFSIVLPPPNVTGTLHTGHSFMLAVQDLMVRFNRMQGKKTLWIPGTDHAAISTESVVVKQLAKDKKTKHEIGREAFLEQVNAFAQNSHDTIVSQLRKMGGSLDWSREAFTLDKKREAAVYAAFQQMYTDGLIYRGNRVINWDPKGQTTVSDDEVDHEPRKATLYYFKYSNDFPITIATSRPETKFGDTAVAVHPSDTRYQAFVGKTYEVNFVGVTLSIKIIADDSVDPEFGTGALGVTPAHSAADWEMGQKHNLPLIQVINEYAKMTVDHPDFKDKKTTEARELVVEKLKAAGLMEKEETIDQNVSVSQRTGAIIEPLPKLQWFIDVNKKITARDNKTLKELMLDAVRTDGIKILPDRYERVYFNWIENLRDWCISRQIWYGHRIPVWYKGEEISVGANNPGEGWIQDEDTLDTWFSSGLWTFSTLGWPEETSDLKTYHPTAVLETGHDILFFWVARMILMSTYLLGEIPFKTVYLHGMVLDKNGKKMSKSNPETAIDPLPTIEKYGADALRMAMIVGVGPGSDNSLGEDKIRAYSKFANKIWNATRFVLDNIAGLDLNTPVAFDSEDQASHNELQTFIKEITPEMESYKFYLVSEKLYHYFWHTFADVIIERSKKKITETDSASAKWLLYTQLTTLIKLLHPFMPFVTEEVWSMLPTNKTNEKKLLIIESWPM